MFVEKNYIDIYMCFAEFPNARPLLGVQKCSLPLSWKANH